MLFRLETLGKMSENMIKNSEVENESLTDSSAVTSSSRSSSEISGEQVMGKSCSSPPPPPPLGWPIRRAHISKNRSSDQGSGEKKPTLKDQKMNKFRSNVSELDMMKERFSKLLLGEDMSGSGTGVCPASISHL